MSKCGRKKYIKTNLRQMTMETVESRQDGSVADTVADGESAHMQSQPGQNSIPTLAQVSVAGSGTGRGSPAVTLVQLPSGQTVHVQGVIQTPQPSLIQSPQIQTVQVAAIAEADGSAESDGVIDSHKRREILSRRPSYRKILNELSSDVPGVPKIEEEKSEEEGTPPNIAAMAVPTSIYQTSTGQYSMYAGVPYSTVLALRLLSLHGKHSGLGVKTDPFKDASSPPNCIRGRKVHVRTFIERFIMMDVLYF